MPYTPAILGLSYRHASGFTGKCLARCTRWNAATVIELHTDEDSPDGGKSWVRGDLRTVPERECTQLPLAPPTDNSAPPTPAEGAASAPDEKS